MSRQNWFPRIAASRCVSLLFFCLLSVAFLATTTTESYAQSSTNRPTARLITASRPTWPTPQTQHGVYTRPTAVAASSASVAASGLERQAFNLINVERAKNRLPPLAWDGQLCNVARQHSQNMGRRNFFDHQAPDGSDLLDRVSGINWKSLGENIAYNQGQDDPVAVAVEQWLRSPKHRSNILRGHFTHSAVGIARTADGRVYLTQVFITR